MPPVVVVTAAAAAACGVTAASGFTAGTSADSASLMAFLPQHRSTFLLTLLTPPCQHLLTWSDFPAGATTRPFGKIETLALDSPISIMRGSKRYKYGYFRILW